MTFPDRYSSLKENVYIEGDFRLIPIRFEDRTIIMKWRNEQVYHLRQVGFLTESDQERYFVDVVRPLFYHDKPSQYLFSYLKGDICIGYGGLVHINRTDNHSEISFIMNTELENSEFEYHWCTFLRLIQRVAFDEIGLHKIFTYAYNLRPRLYRALLETKFVHEATLKQHCKLDNNYIDVLIHSKMNTLSLRLANREDVEISFTWASDPSIRKYSFNKNLITKQEHTKWFLNKLKDQNCIYLILEDAINNKLGSIRIDRDNDSWIISYLIDRKYHGRGLGTQILRLLEDYIIVNQLNRILLVGYVLKENSASIRIFEKLDYKKIVEENESVKFIKEIK
ncbi:GNAT family N-acetyltransferase [Sphingobacterium sp. DR205]|uniref:GNAT family N-acetyltransferase n=1 Tax=Sphingobacterium sp. DR205 TaxID=2713573 RepID=UPI0013E4E668|nr:GNAT family N-acetyltransferase [Sphingobacterium sp. DR205]QIH31565.1 GNAT family N-acetyltransferase [Sphingobacterium sp. DR205]